METKEDTVASDDVQPAQVLKYPELCVHGVRVELPDGSATLRLELRAKTKEQLTALNSVVRSNVQSNNILGSALVEALLGIVTEL